MLPERISNHLCSLQAHEPRLCLAVRMVFDKDGRKRSHRFLRGLMRSAAALAYEQAQRAIDGYTDDVTGPLLEPVLRPLWSAYGSLARARADRAPLDLDLPERKIQLDDEGRVRGIITPPRLDAHRLIEEFMIAANVAAAEELEAKRTPLIYRVHDQPSKEKLAALSEFLGTLGLKLPKTGQLKPANFNRILAEASRSSRAVELVGEMVLRTQAQAEYGASNFGHFGLNLRRYAHFTSPIRRYADLIVHRGLIRALGLGEGALPDSETGEHLSEVAAQISVTERRAMKAERETADRLIAHHLADRVGASFQGRISGVTRAGLFVKLDDTGADGLVPIRSLGTEYFDYDETRHALVGSRSGAMHRLGDVVDVRLVEAQPVAGALRFELLSDGQLIPRGRKRDGFERSERRAKDRPARAKREKRKKREKAGGRDKTRKPERKTSGKPKRGKSWKP
jgi:ribonuclease R